MKKYFVLILFVVFMAWTASPTSVNAQTPIPPAATGKVTGKIVNQNLGTVVKDILELMLHIYDEEYVELGMLHAQSQPDGSFMFTEVDLKPGQLYGVMAIYEDVIYLSEAIPAVAGSDQLELEVPVYDTTTDLTAVQIDQMHILFNFAADGLETTEVYILSNQGERTVKGSVTLEDGQLATLSFPLPTDADFIFFQPDQQDRFVKFSGGFADTNPLMIGQGSEQFTVKYLTPFQENHNYTYTAPVNIQAINLLLPEKSGVILHGEGLSAPELTNFNNGESYLVYSLSGINAGQTFQVTFSGKPILGEENTSSKTTLPLVLGGLLLGLVMVGTGIWWWRKPEEEDNENEATGMEVPSGESPLDVVISEIAHLDDAHERGEFVDEEEYHQERMRLRQQAKSILDQQNDPS
ncbi:MAG: hypothetical protein A2X25_11780 [Chloroflexi bacterium GWB2_49_20]|nr:MAG: hypothetical protein A2X25_11780 [Chloroflexi bacterium GWB2_49_20]OGN77685.1 MAG: hypothetical protein A2X26_10050 [Chloroflexi bacterium GWC2_49_37]OGN86460.1 MAG: hypothetical protein A2X27_06205 [Chloroflexi bacterium GWD2_49_16]HBG74705.1 hypothetical protein [Anaerolineae bacterium]